MLDSQLPQFCRLDGTIMKLDNKISGYMLTHLSRERLDNFETPG